MQGANLASSSRHSGKSKHVARKPSPKSSKSPFRHKPKRVRQLDDLDSDHVTHEEHDDHNDDDNLSDGDPKVDFAALAVSYHTIDVRHDSTQYSDESSNDSSTHRCLTRRR